MHVAYLHIPPFEDQGEDRTKAETGNFIQSIQQLGEGRGREGGGGEGGKREEGPRGKEEGKKRKGKGKEEGEKRRRGGNQSLH